MFGKYHDGRVYEHFVHTYSRVPYLDTEIFNVEAHSLKSQRQSQLRVNAASQGIKATSQKAELLDKAIKEARIKKEEDQINFIADLHRAQEESLENEKQSWLQHERQRLENQVNSKKADRYLQNLLKCNSVKAESRLGAVRKWH